MEDWATTDYHLYAKESQRVEIGACFFAWTEHQIKQKKYMILNLCYTSLI